MSEALELHILSLLTALVTLGTMLVGQRNAKRRVHRVEARVEAIDEAIRTPTPAPRVPPNPPGPFDQYADHKPATSNALLRASRLSESTNPLIKSPYEPEGK